MITDKRMKLVKSENGINFYLFRPSVFSLYYNDCKMKHQTEPSHRYSITHKLHMLWYILAVRGGYSILYLEKDNEILSYIIFVKANNQIIKACEKNDYYTIFLWTYPQHRGKGLGTLMANTMLNELNLQYSHFYKTIDKDNYSSIRVAEKSGFELKCESRKSKWLHTIYQEKTGEQYLFC